MTRDLLLEALNKWYILDLILLIFTFMLAWFSVLTVGFHMLKVEVKLKRTIPVVLLLAFISLFLKPFTPGAWAFFVILIPLILFLKFYSKVKWTIAFWVTSILLLSTAVFPMLLIMPLTSSNRALASFFFTTRYGVMITSLTEAIGAVVLLAFLNIFNTLLIPKPVRTVTFTDFIDIYIFSALLFLCYYEFMKIWGSSNQFLMKSFIVWLVAAGALVGFYIKKINDQKKDQKKDQEYQRLKESKIDPQELENYCNLIIKNLNNPDIPDFADISDIEFTRREEDILQLLAQGKSNGEIAQILFLSQGRVTNIVSDVKSKTCLEDRNKLVLYAIYWVRKKKKSL
jgi:DNA-binding CsgD family transcriptional regulator